MHLCICVWVCVCVCECVYLCVSMWKFAYLCICVCVCERQIRVCRKKHNKKTQTNQRLQINKHTKYGKAICVCSRCRHYFFFCTHTCVYWFVHLWVFICSSVCVYYLCSNLVMGLLQECLEMCEICIHCFLFPSSKIAVKSDKSETVSEKQR